MDTLRKLESEAIPDADERLLDKIGETWTLNALRERQFEYGRQKEREEIATRMLKSGVDVEQICFTTNLSREEVEQLRNGRSD